MAAADRASASSAGGEQARPARDPARLRRQLLQAKKEREELDALVRNLRVELRLKETSLESALEYEVWLTREVAEAEAEISPDSFGGQLEDFLNLTDKPAEPEMAEGISVATCQACGMKLPLDCDLINRHASQCRKQHKTAGGSGSPGRLASRWPGGTSPLSQLASELARRTRLSAGSQSSQ